MEVNFKATPKQWEMLKLLADDETTEIGYWWWAWGWKSFAGVFGIWMMAMKYPWTRWFFGRKELLNLKRTTLTSYYKVMTEYEIPENYKWTLNSQTNTIKFPNGSEILLLDCAWQPSDPLYTRFGSLELTWWFIDESNEVQNQCITILNTRLWRQKNKEYGLKPKLLETFNPDKWHIYERYYLPRKQWTLPKYRKFIPALATDNPYLDENYIAQLEKADEITKQRLLYWNFEYDDTPWKLFRWDEITDLFTSNIKKDETVYITCDVARLWDDNTVIIVWNWLEAVEIVSYNWKTTDQTAEIIKELEQRYKCSRYNICIDSDWVWWWVCDQLRWCINFVNNGSPIQEKDEIRNYANLKTQCYFKLKYLMEKRMIKVNSSWIVKDKIQRELDNIVLKNIEWEQKLKLESKEEMKRRLWNSPDYADAIMMRMYWQITRSTSPLKETEVFTVNFDDMLY